MFRQDMVEPAPPSRGRWYGLLAVLVVASLAGCSLRSPLRVGSSGDYPPFSLVDAAGVERGFDVELAERFARDSGRSLERVRFTWPNLVDDVTAGAFEVAMSGVTVRADRALRLRFSRPYAVTGAVVVVARARGGALATRAAIDRPEVRLAVNRGGHLERVTRAHFHQAQIVPVDDNTTLVAVLLAGEVDAVVSEELEARTWPQEQVLRLPPFTRDRKAYAVAPQQAAMLGPLNDWLDAREADGWLADQRRRWFGASAAMTRRASCWEAIAAAIDLRLQLMPAVAAAKRAAGLPLEDPAQEERVLTLARASAAAIGLDAAATVHLFRSLITAAKELQRVESTAVMPPADLAQLRDAVAFASRQLLDEVHRCRAPLADPAATLELAAAFRTGVAALPRAAVDAAQLAVQVQALVR